MPIYEYACDLCAHRFEVVQSIRDAPLKDCPSCEEPGLSKLISRSGFQLKGGGWAADLYGPSGTQKKEG